MNIRREEHGNPSESIESMTMMNRYLRFLFESFKRFLVLGKYFMYYFGLKSIVLYGNFFIK